MITINYKELYVILSLLILYGCADLNDFSIPKPQSIEPVIEVNTSIESIKKTADQSNDEVYTFSQHDNATIEGYVISSDEANNWYKKLIIQDLPENPTAGVEIWIDQKSYFEKYNLGRKVYLKMAGLSIQNTSGCYKIGMQREGSLSSIPESLLDDFIIRSTISTPIIPKEIKLENFKENHVNTFIHLKNVQFKYDELNKTLAGEPYDSFDAERVLWQCDNQLTTILKTSVYASFKTNLISENSGSIKAILSKDFYGEKFVLVINDPSEIDFTNTERCDPSFLSCEQQSFEGQRILFLEDFESITKTRELEDNGWMNTNINFGNERFSKGTSLGNTLVRISAFNSGENTVQSWLITPLINRGAFKNAYLEFDTKAYYDNGKLLTVWVAEDFKGDIKEANWQQLKAHIPVGPPHSYDSNWESSGKIGLACVGKEFVIGFRYQGGDPQLTTTYEIDNIRILAD